MELILESLSSHVREQCIPPYIAVHYICTLYNVHNRGNARLKKACDVLAAALPVINLPVFLCVAGVALMEISEVHRKVHLELEENVSAEDGGTQFINCVASPIRRFE